MTVSQVKWHQGRKLPREPQALKKPEGIGPFPRCLAQRAGHPVAHLSTSIP